MLSIIGLIDIKNDPALFDYDKWLIFPSVYIMWSNCLKEALSKRLKCCPKVDFKICKVRISQNIKPDLINAYFKVYGDFFISNLSWNKDKLFRRFSKSF